MQDTDMDQAKSVSQFLRESYLAETRHAHHTHSDLGRSDPPHHIVFGNLKDKAVDSRSQTEPQFPDLSAFLSQEELNKSVDLACKSFGQEGPEQEDRSAVPHIMSHVTPTVKPSHEKTELVPERQTLQSSVPENKLRSTRSPREPDPDYKKTVRSAPYGLEIQSKKEFLNKAADFIEELSSLFKANSSKRVRPRACKAHRSRSQSKHYDAAAFLHDTEDRERPAHHTEPLQLRPHNDTITEEEPNNTQQEEPEEQEEPQEPEEQEEPICEMKCEASVLAEPEISEPVYTPPHFIQKLKSREVPEGSKVQLDCIVRGFPAPEVRWFCEGKELENSPDIQVINDGELHSLIITEAFEEDTGRYSCFASNFCGTDSTSAEIYIEGATSSDSDGEQYLEAQMHKRASKPSATRPPETPTASLNDEDSLSCNQSAPPETFSAPPDYLTSSTTAAGGDVRPDQVDSSQTPAEEPPPGPASPPIPTGPSDQSANAPPASSLGQETSRFLSTAPHSFTENENGASYPQGLDGRPIMAAPVFTKNLQDVLASEGQLVVLECRVKGVPSPRVDWYREGMVIEDSPDFRILQKKPRSMAEPENICTLVIAEVFLEDSGTFTCTASNKYGTVSSVAVLMVKGNSDNISHHNKQLSTTESCQQEPDLYTGTSKYPLTSCLKAKSKKTLESHSEALSSSRGGRRVTFKLPEEEEKSSKGPPPLLAKPKLNPLQLQILHKQVLLEQQQETDPQNLQHSGSNQEPLDHNPSHLEPSPLQPTPPPYINTALPQITSSPAPALSTAPAPAFTPGPVFQLNMNPAHLPGPVLFSEINPPPPVLLSNPPASQQIIPPHPNLNTVSTRSDPPTSIPQMTVGPTALTPEAVKPAPQPSIAPVSPISHPNMASAAPLSLSMAAPQPVTPIFPQVVTPAAQINTPTAKISMTPPTHSSPIAQINTGPANNSAPGTPADRTVVTTHPLNMSGTKTNISTTGPLTPVSITQTPPVSITQTPPVSINQTPPISITQTPPISITQTPPVSINQTPPISITQTPPVSINQTQPVSITQTTPFSINQTPPVSTNQTPPFSITQNPPVSITQNPPVSTNQTQPFFINQTPPFSINQIPPVSTNQTQPVSIDQTPPFFINQNPPVSIIQTPPFSINQTPPFSINQTPPVSANQTPPFSITQTPPVSANQIPHVSANQTPPFSITQTPPVSANQTPNQSFSYTRPKEFLDAHVLSKCASPASPSATQDFSKPAASLPSSSPFSPALRVFPTRQLESPSSPPYVASPPPASPALVNSVFAFRPQSPPQASSPTSSSSTSSPIQNPVAFLSSVLPSLPTSPPTNAMGLPMRAPRPQATLKKNHRSSWSRSDEVQEVHDVRATVLNDLEKKLQVTNELPQYGQQKLTYGGDASRPLGPNAPTATVINYDEEYKVSNFEQRLMSEIEFRLERTPVEESDDEIQHDEIPTGKCIAPLFHKKLKNFRVPEGIPVTFSCRLVGIPIPKVYWFKDGKQILRNNRHFRRIREGDGTCSLYIESATNDDDGNYTVMAANPQGRISCSGHLIVQSGPMRNRPVIHSQRVRSRVRQVEEGEPTEERFFRPHFLQAPGDTVSHEGRLCRLDCKVSGLPHPDIIWLLNGKPIGQDSSHRMLVRENGVHSLVIDPLAKHDAGTYTCIASNKAGQSSFCLSLAVVEREVKQVPQFVEKLQNTGIPEGSPVRLECRVVGMPPPVIYWKKDNDTVSGSEERFSLHQDATGYGCLLIQPTRKSDAGWYTVSAKNEAGIISCTARLDIYAPWHQWVLPPVRRASPTGSRSAAEDKLVNLKSAYPLIISRSQEDPSPESEEL